MDWDGLGGDGPGKIESAAVEVSLFFSDVI